MSIKKIKLPGITTDPRVKQKEIIEKMNEMIDVINVLEDSHESFTEFKEDPKEEVVSTREPAYTDTGVHCELIAKKCSFAVEGTKDCDYGPGCPRLDEWVSSTEPNKAKPDKYCCSAGKDCEHSKGALQGCHHPEHCDGEHWEAPK